MAESSPARPVVPGQPMSHEEVVTYLTELAERLEVEGVEARIILVGGSALGFYYDRALTRDVDAALYPPEVIKRIAREMAASHPRLGEKWFNDDALAFVPEGDCEGDVAIERGRVTISVATKEALLAMKLLAARRTKDFFDLAYLLRECDVRSFDEAQEFLQRYRPDDEIPRTRESVVRDALGPVTLPTDPQIFFPAVSPRPVADTCDGWDWRNGGGCVLPPGHDGDHSDGQPRAKVATFEERQASHVDTDEDLFGDGS